VAQNDDPFERESAIQHPCQCWQGRRELVNILPKYQYTFLLVQSEDLISFFRTEEG